MKRLSQVTIYLEPQLLLAAKEPGLSIEDTFKRVRVSVNKVTEGRQTPWDSSSLTDDFRFFSGPSAAAVWTPVTEYAMWQSISQKYFSCPRASSVSRLLAENPNSRAK